MVGVRSRTPPPRPLARATCEVPLDCRQEKKKKKRKLTIIALHPHHPTEWGKATAGSNPSTCPRGQSSTAAPTQPNLVSTSGTTHQTSSFATTIRAKAMRRGFQRVVIVAPLILSAMTCYRCNLFPGSCVYAVQNVPALELYFVTTIAMDLSQPNSPSEEQLSSKMSGEKPLPCDRFRHRAYSSSPPPFSPDHSDTAVRYLLAQ